MTCTSLFGNRKVLSMRKNTSPNSQKSKTRTRTRKRVSVETLVDCCRRSNGIMAVVAKMLGVDWHTADKYVRNCLKAQEVFQAAREAVCDVAESNLLRIVNDPRHPRHFDAIQFLLSTVAKKRGYTTRVEQEVSGIKPPPSLNIVIEK